MRTVSVNWEAAEMNSDATEGVDCVTNSVDILTGLALLNSSTGTPTLLSTTLNELDATFFLLRRNQVPPLMYVALQPV